VEHTIQVFIFKAKNNSQIICHDDVSQLSSTRWIRGTSLFKCRCMETRQEYINCVLEKNGG
jgi:hypothetical protein